MIWHSHNSQGHIPHAYANALFGGRTFSTFTTNLEGLSNAQLAMVLLFYFGWTSGMTSSMRSFQDYSDLQRIKRY
jgi:hypothetical protein